MKARRELRVLGFANKLVFMLSDTVRRQRISSRAREIEHIFQTNKSSLAMLVENMKVAVTNTGRSHRNTCLRDGNSEINGADRSRHKIRKISRDMTVRTAVLTLSEVRVKRLACGDLVNTGDFTGLPARNGAEISQRAAITLQFPRRRGIKRDCTSASRRGEGEKQPPKNLLKEANTRGDRKNANHRSASCGHIQQSSAVVQELHGKVLRGVRIPIINQEKDCHEHH